MQSKNKKYHSYKKFLFEFIFIIIFQLKTAGSKLLDPQYNNGNQQDPKLDELYTDSPGRNLYYMTKGSYKTMYNFFLNPDETLDIYFKMYTDSEILINALENGYKIYFGFDFMIESDNETLNQYNTDIIVCIFDKNDVNCYDYAFDKDNNKYIRNNNGTFENFLIPLGFNNVTLNILTKNVIGYKNYYCVHFYKKFKDLYKNATLYNWFKYLPNKIIHKVIGFYGITENDDDLIKFSPGITEYYQKLLFENGAGLKPNNPDKIYEIFTVIKYAILLYFAFHF